MRLFVYTSIKPIYYFIDKDLGSLFGIQNFWSSLFLVLNVVVSLYFIVWTAMVLYLGMKPWRMWFSYLPMALSLALAGLNGYLYSELGSEGGILFRNAANRLPVLILVVITLMLILLWDVKHRKTRVLLAAGLILGIQIYALDIAPLQFTSDPVVFMVGDQQVSVTWTTNKASYGVLVIGDQTYSDHAFGLRKGSATVHTVTIPVDLLDNGYSVMNTETKAHYQNNVVFGRTIESDMFQLTSSGDDRTSFYVLSDTHERKDIYRKIIQDPADFVMLNGDFISSVDETDIIVENVMHPLSQANSSLVLYSRGNHETRGVDAHALPSYMPLYEGRYYYSFECEGHLFIVLDSGEDKLDDHEEYSGLVDFDAYHEKQLQWLETLVSETDFDAYESVVAFSHIPLNDFQDKADGFALKETFDLYRTLLEAAEVDILFSGHTHETAFIDANEHHDFPIAVSGGYVKNNSGFEAYKVVIDDGVMTIWLINEDGYQSIMKEIVLGL